MDRYRIALVAFACLLASPPTAAQQRVVGVLAIGSPEMGLPLMERTVVKGLRELGYTQGNNFAIEYGWARGDLTRYPELARKLMERRPAVILTPCGPSLKAIRELSKTVPVIANCADESNFLGEVASLSRPGGYTTGITFFSPETVGKRIEIMREVIPGFTRLAILYEPRDPIPGNMRELERLQTVLGLILQRVAVGTTAEFEEAFAAMARERAQVLYVFPTNRLVADRTRIAQLARKHRIPTISEFSFNADTGGLISYGGSVDEWTRKTTPMYIDRILKGAKPGDLPIMQPTQFELVVNLKTARDIGVTIPQSVLLRADRVIE